MKIVRPLTPPGRSGNTLAEVLMSLLVFGIGAVAVATLFPVSVVRSLNATRLTKGTIHRYNAEAMVDLQIDSQGRRVLIHDPDRNANFREHFNKNYIVDPLGWHNVDPAIQSDFGNDGTNPSANALRRYNGGFSTASAARALTISPDSWVQVFDNPLTVSNVTATSVDVTGADLGEVSTGTPGSRITLFDDTGRFSIARKISGISGNTVSWSAPLPAEWFGSGALYTPATARIETQELQFSWLLTVRNRGKISTPADNLKANVDVVIFFRRTFSLKDEQVYQLKKVGTRDYVVQLAGGTALPPVGGTPRPFLKQGGYLLDLKNARWYRIQQLSGENSTAPRIRLNFSPPVGEVLNEVVIPRGVVEVYPIGTK